MDLSKLDTVSGSDHGADMELVHPINRQPFMHDLGDGKSEPLTIRMAGIDSDLYRKAGLAITNKRIAMKGRGTSAVRCGSHMGQPSRVQSPAKRSDHRLVMLTLAGTRLAGCSRVR